MRKKLWTVGMALLTTATLLIPNTARADGEACFKDGEHVNPSNCSTDCCSKECNACNTDGHYTCGKMAET